MNRILKTLAAVSVLALATACADDRTSVLKVYNWSDYIDESVIPEFEQWYEEQTGEKVNVIYQTFDVNETMLSKIEKGHEDYDVVCPSDYIIERMLKMDLLQPIDRDFGQTPDYISSGLSPFILGCFDKIDGGGRDANDYSVAFMWGTTGILYNAGKVDGDDAKSWDIVRNPKYSGKIFIKDSARDVFSQIIIYLNRDALREGRVTLDSLMHDSSDAALDAVEAYMKQVKPLVAGWEADFGKEQMTQERGWVNLTWSGDAVWAIEEGAEVGVDLRYVCPEEGFTVWFDGWAIPKYARNVKAARYWINFMCRPDIVIRNVDVTGYVSAIASPEILDAFTDEDCEALDLSYFFGPDAASVHANPVLYPDRSDIERCTMEHDWGERTEALIAMWGRVKGQSADVMTLLVIGTVLGSMLALGIFRKTSKSRRRRRVRLRRRRMERGA